jgi:hypothetical protein
VPHGISNHDTFYRVFARLDPERFNACVATWMAGECEATGLRHIAIDGKAVRSAPRATFSGCVHLVSAWAAVNRLILGQEAVADKSHVIAAVPEVLEWERTLVTHDAAGCQKRVAEQVRGEGGDYLLVLKGNQPSLRETALGGVRPGDRGGLRRVRA